MSRTATVTRTTKETDVRVELNLDGSANATADTGHPVLRPHAAAAGQARGLGPGRDVQGRPGTSTATTRWRTVGIALGQALSEALGDKSGVRRFASIMVPLDEAAVEVALDLSGRNFVVFDVPMPAETIGEFDTGLVEDFVRAFAQSAEPHDPRPPALRTLTAPRLRSDVQGVWRRRWAMRASLTGRAGVPCTKGTL